MAFSEVLLVSQVYINLNFHQFYLIFSHQTPVYSSPAPCAVVDPWEAYIIGFIGGFIAVVSVLFFDFIHVDDPVGAISVHGMAGIWVSTCMTSFS